MTPETEAKRKDRRSELARKHETANLGSCPRNLHCILKESYISPQRSAKMASKRIVLTSTLLTLSLPSGPSNLCCLQGTAVCHLFNQLSYFGQLVKGAHRLIRKLLSVKAWLASPRDRQMISPRQKEGPPTWHRCWSCPRREGRTRNLYDVSQLQSSTMRAF